MRSRLPSARNMSARGLRSGSGGVQALAALFMMNNAHFMVKTVEGSEALMLLGPDWLERQKDKVRPDTELTLTVTWPKVHIFNLTLPQS